MNNSFWMADPHWGHGNILKYCDRFKFMSSQESEALVLAKKSGDRAAEKAVYISPATVQKMDDNLLIETNLAVQPNDTLYIHGDFAWVKTHEEAAYYRECINCKNVILIWGNHDNRNLLKGLFQGYYDILDKKINGQHIVMCHYPFYTWDRSHYGSWHTWGHLHHRLKSKPGTFSVDVGIDGWDYKPVSFEQLKDYMSKKDPSGEQGYFYE